MVKKYLATQDDVQIVSDDVATINTQLNTPVTGLDARVQATEAYETRITQAESDIDGLDTQINDPATGVIKQLVDVDTELNEATTGVKARLDDLEQGGGGSGGGSIVEYVNTDIPDLSIGCDYAVNTTGGTITIIVPIGFTDKFRVYDYSGSITVANHIVVDLTAFGQGLVEMINKDDDIEFMYINGEWWLNDINGQNRSKV